MCDNLVLSCDNEGGGSCVSLWGKKVKLKPSYLPRYCYFVVNKSFAAYLAVEAVGKWLAVLAALDHCPALTQELDSLNALAFQFGDPSC